VLLSLILPRSRSNDIPDSTRQEESRVSITKANGNATPSSKAPSTAPSTAPSAVSSGPSYSSYRTAEERAAYIKQQAEQRMAERLAALGIKPMKVGESPQERADRERKEQEERLRKAEEQDAQREQQRQRKLDDEQITPPVLGKPAKKPPPPPSRKGATSSSALPAVNDVKKVEQELRAEQDAQESERLRLE
jgi:hypothetical protein